MVLEMQYGPAGERGANTAADMKMSPVTDVEYELASGLDKPATKARAWKATVPRDARARLAALARSLGVEGEVYEQSGDQLAVGDPSGDARTGDASVTMWVGGGPAAWSYYVQSGSASGTVSEPCAPDAAECTSSSDSVLRPPATMAEPQNLPSESEALASAKKILVTAGYDPEALELDATTSTWSTYVSFEEMIDGKPTGMFGAIDFGADAVVASAWGQFARYDEADTYPLIDLDDALDRFGTSTLGRFTTKSAAPSPGVATPETAVPDDAATDTVSPSTSVARTVVVRITQVDLVLQPLYSSQSAVYLVPSYRFSDRGAEVGTVYAVPDEFISIAEPAIPEPAPVDPGTGASTPGQSGSGSSGSSGKVDPGSVAPPEDTPIADADAQRLVGLSETEAVKVAESNGWAARVVERDGESYMVTTDWRSDRVNLTVANGTVTAVSVG